MFGIALATAAEDAAAQTAQCSPAPADCSGWYRTNVTVQWSWPANAAPVSCQFATISSDTTGQVVGCTISVNGSERGSSVTIRRDATRPQVTGANPTRAPDEGGWYNHPVAINVTGSDATSGIVSCTRPELSGPDGAASQVAVTCTDVAGNVSVPTAVTLKYDATAPNVEVAPDRPPDGGNWYRRPVTVRFNGSDATSGIASCTPPAKYEGPDQPVKLVGTCRDAAGNATEVAHEFGYDATPPKLGKVTTKLGKGWVRLRWARPAEAASIRIVRRPGRSGAASSVLYSGGVAVSYADKTIRAGIAYRYEVSAADEAGNVTSVVVNATRKRPPLYQPAKGAAVRPPVRLAWEGKASFYNVQLFRGGVKLLSAWPGAKSLRLRATWQFGGKRHRLVPGRYRWYVWGASGTRAKPRYDGKPLGTSTFVVRGKPT